MRTLGLDVAACRQARAQMTSKSTLVSYCMMDAVMLFSIALFHNEQVAGHMQHYALYLAASPLSNRPA